MVTIHDQFSQQVRNRLQTTGMGLGLARLLQDAGRIEEARTTLSSLEIGFPCDAAESETPSQQPRKANRSRRVSGRFPVRVRSA